MAHGKVRDQSRERKWRRHVQRQCDRGITARHYCVDHQVPESAFCFWRRVTASSVPQPISAQVTPRSPLRPRHVPQPGGHQHKRRLPVGKRLHRQRPSLDLQVQALQSRRAGNRTNPRRVSAELEFRNHRLRLIRFALD
jgi:hypothetical protein